MVHEAALCCSQSDAHEAGPLQAVLSFLTWQPSAGEEDLPPFLRYSNEELQEAAAANQKSRGPSSRPLAAALSAPPQVPFNTLPIHCACTVPQILRTKVV